jgi:O-antigen/teichoic acid export membrane protein
MYDLSRITFTGIGWVFFSNMSARLIGLGAQLLLALILLPDDFANFGLAGTVYAIIAVLVTFGIDDVLLQRSRSIRYWETPAFVISFVLGLVGMLLIMLAAPIAAKVYHAPILLSVLPIMGLSIPIAALSTVPFAKIRSALDFRFLATYTAIETAVAQILTIALAFKGLGVYSFVIPPPILAAVRAAVFWIRNKPTLRRIRTGQLRMIGLSGAMIFGTKVITALVGQGDYFVLGIFAPKTLVGNYFFAFRLAVQPVQMLAGSLGSVLFPALARLRDQPQRQAEAALKAARMLALAVMPVGFMQAALARPLFSLLFATKWQDAIPLVEILSIGLAFDSVSWIAGALLSARGEFRRSFIYSCLFSPFFLIFVTIGAIYGAALGVAIAASMFYVLLAPMYSYAVFSKVGVPFWEFSKILIPPTLFGAVSMTFANWIASRLIDNGLAQCTVIVILGSTAYLVLLLSLGSATYRQLLDELLRVYARGSTPNP